jgi:hypothetical protein
VKVRVGLLVVLAVLVAVFAVLRLGVDRAAGDKPLYPDFRPESVARITIDGKQRQSVFEKAGDVWLVVSEDSFPAEAGVVDAMLSKVTGFSLKDMISSNPEKQQLYQVDSTGIAVTMETADGDTVASFVIGKAGPDYQSTYVRASGSSEVILAPGYLPQAFERGNRSWQDRTIYAFEPDDFLAVTVNHRDETVALKRNQAGQWFISEPESLPADAGVVSRLLRTLGRLRCDDFAGRTRLPEYGLAASDSSLHFTTADGAEHEIVFGSPTEDDRVYTATSDSDIVYLLSSYKVGGLLPRLDKLESQEPEAPEEK